MKTIKTITTIIIAALSAVSCSDYLDIDIQEKQSTDISYNKVSNIDQALNGVYGCLRPLSKYYWQMSEARSDNSWVNVPSNVRAASQIAHFENSILKENSIILNCWNDYFKVTAAANKLLSEIDNVDFSEVSSKLNGIGKTAGELRTHYKAEARFLRALAYFDLVRFFGRVPATTKYLTTEEAFQLKQSEPTDVLENIIIPDLQYAVGNLSYAPFDYQGASRLERAAKPAAQALLARVYLTMEGYPYYDTSHHDEAVSLLKDIIDYSAANSGKWWATNISDWEKMWVHENDNKYFIFEIQYALAASMGNPMTPVSVSWSLVNSEWCTKNYVNADVITYVANDLRSHFTDPDVDDADIEYYDKRGPATLSTISVAHLAKQIGTNRSYLSKYFALQGITYNAYINGLRIQHFVKLYQETTASHQSTSTKQLAFQSGFRSYSTFNAAFKLNMGMTAGEWMRIAEELEPACANPHSQPM